jgi:hypothetical protein
LLLRGDIVHAAEVQFADPAVTIDYDIDPAQAVTARRRVLEDSAQDEGGAHLSFPGIRHVRFDNGQYAWVPAPYQAKTLIDRTSPGRSSGDVCSSLPSIQQ